MTPYPPAAEIQAGICTHTNHLYFRIFANKVAQTFRTDPLQKYSYYQIFAQKKKLWRNILTVINQNEFIIGYNIIATVLVGVIERLPVNERLQFAELLRCSQVQADLAGFTTILVEIMASFISWTVTVFAFFGRQDTFFALVVAKFCRTANFRSEKTRAD